MMDDQIAIKVESLSKVYKLYDSKYDFLKELFNPFRKEYHKKFYALKDVSFQVKKGEVLGIIGKNGSGKSTLLKILASIVTPTAGSYLCKGKVSALLELGGGFDKNLTGIQNIEFLLALQGFKREKIKHIKKSIIEFADIGDFIYQPVKTYSSGMYMRLAFSIAISIDPEILIVDEIIGVGDMRFQQKCFRKMQQFKDDGKTIILCTHNINAIKTFCSKAVWLDKGQVKEFGNPTLVTDYYNAYMNSETTNTLSRSGQKAQSDKINPIIDLKYKGLKNINWINLEKSDSFGDGNSYIKFAAIVNESNKKNDEFRSKDKISLLLYVTTPKKIVNPVFQLLLTDRYGTNIMNIFSSSFKSIKLDASKTVIISFSFEFPQIGNGKYSFSLGLLSQKDGKKQFLQWIHNPLVINVNNDNLKYKTGAAVILEDVTISSEPVNTI